MADNQPHPGPPPGFQRPGIPGAGNILDPAVRGELREKVHEAVHGGGAQARGNVPQPGGAAPEAPPQKEAAAPAPEAAPAAPESYRAGPFPHGDVDLRGKHPANVPPGPVRPNRGRAGRRFYFLAENAPAKDPKPPPDRKPPDVRKPG